MSLKFHSCLYLDKSIKNADEIFMNISKRIDIYNLYLILISKNINHIFDIVKLSEILKNKYDEKDYIVLGMAYGKKKAFNITKDIFQDYIDNKKDIKNIKHNFIKNK